MGILTIVSIKKCLIVEDRRYGRFKYKYWTNGSKFFVRKQESYLFWYFKNTFPQKLMYANELKICQQPLHLTWCPTGRCLRCRGRWWAACRESATATTSLLDPPWGWASSWRYSLLERKIKIGFILDKKIEKVRVCRYIYRYTHITRCFKIQNIS